MPDKPFIAARIPESLNNALNEYTQSTGENRTQAIINALAKYLDVSPGEEIAGSSKDRLSTLETRVADLERIVKEPRQISLLGTFPIEEETDERKAIRLDNASDNRSEKEVKDVVIEADNTDNSIDNQQINRANTRKSKATPLPQRGELLFKGLRTAEIPALSGLENEDVGKLKTKLNNAKNAQTGRGLVHVGRYLIVLAIPENGVVKGKQKLIWDVYEAIDNQLSV